MIVADNHGVNPETTGRNAPEGEDEPVLLSGSAPKAARPHAGRRPREDPAGPVICDAADGFFERPLRLREALEAGDQPRTGEKAKR